MKKIILTLLPVLLIIIFATVFSQSFISNDREQSGIWKTFPVLSEVMADTLDFSTGADTVYTNVFPTYAIMSACLTTKSDSIGVTKVMFKQWYQHTNQNDLNKFVYISDLSWKGRAGKTGTARIDTAGTFIANITASEIACVRYCRLAFVTDSTNTSDGAKNKAYLTISSWNANY